MGTPTAVVEVAEVAASSPSVLAAGARLGAYGIGLGILAMVGADAYDAIKGVFKRKTFEGKTQEALQDAAELAALRKIHGAAGKASK